MIWLGGDRNTRREETGTHYNEFGGERQLQSEVCWRQLQAEVWWTQLQAEDCLS